MARSVPTDFRFALLFMVMLVIGAGNTALQSVLPALGRSIGVPDSAIAAAFSVSAAVWVFAAPVWARRSDHQGRRRMVLIGLTGFMGSIALCGVVLTLGIHNVLGPLATMACFIAARLLYGYFGAAAPPAAQAMVALGTSRADRLRALSLFGSAFGLGTIIGPALAPFFILPVVGLAGPCFVFAAIAGAVLVVAWHRLPLDSGDPHGTRGAAQSYPGIGATPTGAAVTAATATGGGMVALRDPRIWPWMAIGLAMGHAQAMTGQAIGFLVIDRLGMPLMEAQRAIGIVLMTGAGAALLVQWGLIPLLGWSARTLVLVGSPIAALGCALIAGADSLYAIAMAFALTSLGFGFVRPGYTAGASLAVGAADQGAVAGKVTSVNGAAFVLGPSIGVAMYELSSPLPYLVAAAAMLLVTLYAARQITASSRSEG